MNQRASLADAFGDVRRELLQLDDVDRPRRSVHRDAEDLEEFGRAVLPLDREVQVGDLAETLPIEQEPSLVGATRIHLCGDPETIAPAPRVACA